MFEVNQSLEGINFFEQRKYRFMQWTFLSSFAKFGRLAKFLSSLYNQIKTIDTLQSL